MDPIAAQTAAPLLAELTADSEPDIRARAVVLLGLAAEAEGPALPFIVWALQDDSPRVRRAAGQALLRLAPKRRSELIPHLEARVPQWIAVLEEAPAKGPDDRDWILPLLGVLGREAEAAVPVLISHLGSRGYDSNVFDALARIGRPALPPLVEALKNPAMCCLALSCMERMGPEARDAVPEMVALLKEPDLLRHLDHGAVNVILTLKAIGPGALDAAPALLEIVRGHYPSPSVPYGYECCHPVPPAQEALEIIDPTGEAREPLLARALDHDDVHARLYSAERLCGRGPWYDRSRRVLIDALEHHDGVARARAAGILLENNLAPVDALKVLKQLVYGTEQPASDDAAWILWNVTGDAAAGARVLRRRLGEQDEYRREAAISIVKYFPKLCPQIVPELTQALHDGSENVRYEALQGLKAAGQSARPAIPHLVSMLGEAPPWIAGEAAGIILELSFDPDTTLMASEAAIRMGTEEVAERAGRRLVEMGGQALPVLDSLLAQESWEARQNIVGVLGKVGSPPEMVAGILMSVLANDPHEGVRAWAAGALRNMDLDPELIRPVFLEALKDSSWSVRDSAIAALKRHPSEEGIVPLVELLGDEECDHEAVEALAAIGRPAVPHLVRALRSGNEEIASRAAEGLGLVGPDARDAAPALLKTHEAWEAGDCCWVGIEARGALRRIGKGALPAFIDALEWGNTETRHLALQLIGDLGPDAKHEIETLEKWAEDNDRETALLARRALWRLSGNADPHLWFVADMVREGTREEARLAARVLGEMAAAVPEVLPALTDAFRNGWTSRAAVGAMGSSKTSSPELEMATLEAVAVARGQGRREAIELLLRFRPRAEAAIPVLVEALTDPEVHTRAAADQALARMLCPQGTNPPPSGGGSD